jgi:hypothetical protein
MYEGMEVAAETDDEEVAVEEGEAGLIECWLCGALYSANAKMWRDAHQKNCADLNIYCQFCGKNGGSHFPSNSALAKHMKAYHK